jgi:hypothetical protein
VTSLPQRPQPPVTGVLRFVLLSTPAQVVGESGAVGGGRFAPWSDWAGLASVCDRGHGLASGASSPAGSTSTRLLSTRCLLAPRQREPSMCSMSTDSGAQDGAVPHAAASDARSEEASPPASPEQIYEEVMVRLGTITEEWQKARDALRSG